MGAGSRQLLGDGSSMPSRCASNYGGAAGQDRSEVIWLPSVAVVADLPAGASVAPRTVCDKNASEIKPHETTVVEVLKRRTKNVHSLPIDETRHGRRDDQHKHLP